MIRRRKPAVLRLRPSANVQVVSHHIVTAAQARKISRPQEHYSHVHKAAEKCRRCSRWKRVLKYYGILKKKHSDFYMDWMEDHDQHSQRLHYYIATGLGFQPAVEEELKRYRSYYTVSAIPAKPLHMKEMVMPDWKPLLENAFAWLGDWRPSAILGFLLMCHEANAVQLPTHHVDFVKELIRISHHNETILDERLAEYQAMSAFNPAVATPRNADQPLPALFFALHDSSNTSNNKNDAKMKSHVKDELVTCVRRDLTRMNRIVMQAHDMRFNAVEVVVNRLLTWTQAAYFLFLLAKFQTTFHAFAVSRMDKFVPVRTSKQAQEDPGVVHVEKFG